MKVTLVLPGVLRDDAGGLGELTVEPVDGAADVGAVLDAVGQRFPLLERRIRDETGELRRHVNLFVGSDDVRAIGGSRAPVQDGTVVVVLPSVAGG